MIEESLPIRPFLKWAGNKYRIIARVKGKLPEGKRLLEPFVGSGALFLNTDFPAYRLSDSNRDLIDLYRILQQEGEQFIEGCRTLFTANNNRPETYYRLREEFNSSDDPRVRASLFIYLNRHGYNGLCRYNASGGFNVPFGRYKKPYFPEKEMLAFHLKARNAVFEHADFQTTMKGARKGDVIYCDPPYVPLSSTASFTSYSAGGFGSEQQLLLATLAESTARRGIPVLISNHNTKFTQELYAQARLTKFKVHRSISCNGRKRESAGELLALFAG